MTPDERNEIAERAARAAREAADEAATPEARFFLRGHADRLARLAAAERRTQAAGRRSRDLAGIVAPLMCVTPL